MEGFFAIQYVPATVTTAGFEQREHAIDRFFGPSSAWTRPFPLAIGTRGNTQSQIAYVEIADETGNARAGIRVDRYYTENTNKRFFFSTINVRRCANVVAGRNRRLRVCSTEVSI